MRFLVTVALALLASPLPLINAEAQQPSPTLGHRLADGFQRKLDHIESNAALARPDQSPTTISEEELNDYLAAGRIQLPEGVRKVTFRAQPSVITAHAIIDFDNMRAAQTFNPLLLAFRGTHEVSVEAEGAAHAGEARLHIRDVSLDGIDIPGAAIEAFLNAYVTPLYPNVGIDTAFRLANGIDSVAIGDHRITVAQK